MSTKKKGEDLWALVDGEQNEGGDEGDTTTLFVGTILSPYV